VLEIGTGSGYQATRARGIGGPHLHHRNRSRACTIGGGSAEEPRGAKRDSALRRRLSGLDRGSAPFDRIILTAAPPEIPQALVDQLRPGGRMLAPVGGSPFAQSLVVVNKLADGSVRKRSVIPVAFVPMVREKP